MERNYLKRLNSTKTRGLIIITAVLVIGLFLLVKFNPLQSNNPKTQTSNKTAIRDAIATLPLNKEFKFPLKDEKSETVGEIKYFIENAEIRDEIVIKGRKASAVKGRTFLILNLKIVNDSNKTISMSTKDYVRLSVNGNETELLAPTIHNDPVVVDAISTKPTRIGFAINESDKNLKIKVGEIKGEKVALDINFKK